MCTLSAHSYSAVKALERSALEDVSEAELLAEDRFPLFAMFSNFKISYSNSSGVRSCIAKHKIIKKAVK